MKDGDEWNTVKDKDKVEPAIMNNNSARFSLTKQNPLMSNHISTKLGFLVEAEYADNILTGKFKPDPETDENNKIFYYVLVNKDS